MLLTLMIKILPTFPFIFHSWTLRLPRYQNATFQAGSKLGEWKVKNPQPQPMAVHPLARYCLILPEKSFKRETSVFFELLFWHTFPCPCTVPASQHFVAVNTCISKQFRTGGNGVYLSFLLPEPQPCCTSPENPFQFAWDTALSP